MRTGFTLVELLVVIAIIGVLVSLGMAAYMRAVWRSQEVAMTSDLKQIEASLENFKAKYGFYPPDFSRLQTVNDFIPYLNRIAPNHAYTNAQLLDWWNRIGIPLKGSSNNKGPMTSYVFWLSGLSKNKQFPLSNPSTQNPLLPFNVGLELNNANAIIPSAVPVEREVHYDFQQSRLINVYNQTDDSASDYANFRERVRGYSQAAGRLEPILYMELNSLAVTNNAAQLPAYLVRTERGVCTVRPYIDPTTLGTLALSERLANRNSFQLLAPGMDAAFTFDGGTTSLDLTAATPAELKFQRDNLVNFVDGTKLEIMLTN